MDEEKPVQITPITEEKKESNNVQTPQSESKQAFCGILFKSNGKPCINKTL